MSTEESRSLTVEGVDAVEVTVRDAWIVAETPEQLPAPVWEFAAAHTGHRSVATGQ